MSDLSAKRYIVNKTDSRNDHKIRFLVCSDGRPTSKAQSLKSGERAALDPGDRLVVLSDKRTNYEIRFGNGVLLGVEQINNDHSEYPGWTVASYRLASASKDDKGEIMEVSGTDSGDDDPDRVNGTGGHIIVTEPDQPQP